MAFTEADLKTKLKEELATAAETTQDEVDSISSALAKAIFAFLQEAAEAGDLDA